MQHVFIVGAKGLNNYGGYETFLNKLTEYHQNNKEIQYHIACKANGDGFMDETQLEGAQVINSNEFMYHNAHCFKVLVPNIGPAQAVAYDVLALKECCKYIKNNNIDNPIVYILACRIGPFAHYFHSKVHKLNGKLMINPDGHEWMRAKWNAMIRKYWKLSEKMMVKNADLVICDSVNIEKYINDSYGQYHPETTYIAYGSETRESILSDNDSKFNSWLEERQLKVKEYYLVVGRFVPENNYETMIREFMKSDSEKDFALITKVDEKFLEALKTRTGFDKDPRIKFVGTVYDQELLMKIRENAYAYFHGHEVGGTNPSLLEALGSTKLNLLLDVGFNKEVAEDAALYWNKEEGCLAELINDSDKMTQKDIDELGQKAKQRIKNKFSWEFIANEYGRIFIK